jgi:hypothetical protein
LKATSETELRLRNSTGLCTQNSMAGVTLSRTAALVPCASQQQHGVHRSDASENCDKLRLRSFEELKESQKGVFLEKEKTMSLKDAVAAVPLKRARGGGALCAHMVAVPCYCHAWCCFSCLVPTFSRRRKCLLLVEMR